MALVAALVLLAGTAAVYAASSTPTFSLSAQPQGETIDAGQSASYVVSITPSNGFTGAVMLTAGSLPPGSTSSWTVGASTTSGSAGTVPAGQSTRTATLTLITTGSTPSSTYSPAIAATSGTLTHAATVTLSVQSKSAPNFTLSVSPSNQSTSPGGSTTATVTLTRSNWSGPVTLGPVPGLPSGTAASFSPNPVPATQATATMTLQTSSSTPIGTRTPVLQGSGLLMGKAAATRAAPFTLTVQQPQGVPFTISGRVSSLLYPGTSAESIPVTLSNPGSVTIYVTGLNVSMQSTGATGCSASWFQITQSNISGTQTVGVPATSSVTLPSQGATAPSIQMTTSPNNQDACQDATLSLAYTGSAHS